MAKKAASPAPKASGPDLLGMFNTAKTGTEAKKGGKKDDTVWFEFRSKMKVRLASALDSLAKTIISHKITIETSIKAAIVDEYFIPDGMETKKCPPNVKVNDNGHIIGLQLNKRPVSSPLSDDERKRLSEHKIPFEKLVTVPAALQINPDYLTIQGQHVIVKLQEILANHPEIPADFIVPQTEKFAWVTTEKTLDELFAKELPAKTIKELLPMVSVQVIKYGSSLMTKDDLNEVEGMLFPKEEEAAA